MSAIPALTVEQARRIAVRAQLLDMPRPDDLLDTVRHLTLLQIDLTDAVAPSHDLVLWSRLGAHYRPDDLERLIEAGRLIEYQLLLRPVEDLALYRGEMARWPGPEPHKDWQIGLRDWLQANRGAHADVLAALRSDGPLPARALPDTCAVPWRSSGWTHHKNTQKLVDLLEARGEIAVAGREGRERLWDLAERVWPDLPDIPAEEARAERDRRRLAALGIARARAAQTPSEPHDVSAAGVPVTIEGIRGQWRVDADQLARVDQPLDGRTVLLSPLDRLVYDRKRMVEIFDFDYALEMYKPVADRRWGYWALPILHGEQLVGKLDASADHRRGVLRVDAMHQDEPFTPETGAAVERELSDLASWLGLRLS